MASIPAAGPLPRSVRIEAGHGGLARVAVATRTATAEMYLQGAHVAAWRPAGSPPVLWMSEHGDYAAGRPLRGGVPVCFPWFGPDPAGTGPLHGFARITEWALTAVEEREDHVTLTFALDSDAVRDPGAWTHRFAASYTVTVGRRLTLELTITNTGLTEMTFDESLHTYLAVGDARAVRLTGLEQSAFIDRTRVGDWQAPSDAALGIEGETDRVYVQPGDVTVADPTARRELTVTATGSAHAVVWNPGATKSVAMRDFGDEEWMSMVCVETANVLDGAITLRPGEHHTMTAVLTATPRG